MTAKKIKHLKIMLGGLLVMLVLAGVLLRGQDASVQVIIQLRVPRVLFALGGGVVLVVSALLLQTTLRSDYLDGSMLGLANGAELALALVNVLFARALPYRVLVGALAGGILVVCLRVTLFKVKHSSFFLILGGLALAMFFAAATQLLTTGGGFQGKSLANTTWIDVWLLAIVIVVGAILLLSQWTKLDAFALPSLQARQLGLNEQSSSLTLQLVAGLWLGAVSAVLGTVFFVGLVLVQLVKLVTQVVARKRMGLTAMVGGVVLLGADDLAHYLLPARELPTNAVLLLLTAPLILVLLKRWLHEV